MRFLDRTSFLRIPLGLLLALALLGVVFQECALRDAACKGDCCAPTPACLTLNFSQSPASVPDLAPSVPAVRLLLLAVLFVAALAMRSEVSASFAFLPSRAEPGRRRAPSRAQLHSWTL